jgi:hypothetical protein
MKVTDQYEAKLDIWAREGKVYPLPKAVGIPAFRPQKFSSHAEFNAWKRLLRDAIADQGGLTWTR